MNGIIKHVFKPKNIIIDALTNEPKVIDEEPIILYFSLLQQGHQIFEEIYGAGIMSVIASISVDTKKITNNIKNTVAQKKLIEKEMKSNSRIMDLITNSKFISSLAAASYIKINDRGEITNTIATANELLESNMINSIVNDFEFTQKLIQMVTESLPQESRASVVKQGRNKSPKK